MAIRWIGGAVAVAQETTITIGGTWATSDTVTATINGRDLVLTVGTSAATTAIADDLSAAINASDKTTSLGAGYSRNVGGQQIPEFTELSASVSGSVVTVTTKSAYRGRPFTLTATKSSTSGTVTVATPTAATGPNHADNADNWEGGSLPTDADIMQFDAGSVSVLYGLTYFTDNTIATSLVVTGDYTGQIGLPPYNASIGYPEYRSRYFELYSDGGEYILFDKGTSGATTHGDIRLHLENDTLHWTSIESRLARGSSTSVPSVYIHGGVIRTVQVVAGRLSLDPLEAEALSGSMEISHASNAASLRVGSPVSQGEAWVQAGSSVDFSECEDVLVYGGTLNVKGDVVYSGGGTESFVVYGGTCVLDDRANPTLREIIVRGGTLKPNHQISGGSSPKLTAYDGGIIDFRDSNTTRDHSSIVLYSGAALYDPAGLGTAVVNLVGCTVSDVTLQIQDNRKLTLSAAAT